MRQIGVDHPGKKITRVSTTGVAPRRISFSASESPHQARYRRVVSFWKQNADLRKMFLRYASYSNRRPESHPDYLVAFRNNHGTECTFVEVKSPRESLRASQRQFFPELVKKAGQRVMLVRLTEDGENVRFFEFNSGGDLLPCSR